MMGIFLAGILSACEPEDNLNWQGEISDVLHLSFMTPEWEKFINCEHLDLYPNSLDENISYVTATSQSTRQRFYFTYPSDSSAIVSPGNFKKYSIREFGAHTGPFEFSQVLPVKEGGGSFLGSKENIGEDSFNEIVEIKYVGSENEYAIFTVKSRYTMTAYEYDNQTNEDVITGTFHFKIRTTRN